MHTAIVAGWAAEMLLYEVLLLDPTDPVFNPIWRQGCYVIPFVCRLGILYSTSSWSIGTITNNRFNEWTFENVILAHLLLSGFLILSCFWHWSFWDLDLFISSITSSLALDLSKIFGIHLLLASLTCFGFGYCHLSGFFGVGMWTSDSFGIVGSIRFVKPEYGLLGLALSNYGYVSSHHISSGIFGVLISIWHISSRPGRLLYKYLKMSNIESVLSSSIAACFFPAFINSALMWYGSVTTAIELFGPTRYHWDNGYFSRDIERRVKSLFAIFISQS